MLTVFAVPKPFEGQTGTIQRNAIESWRRLHPDADVILFGEGPDHVEVERNEHGTPLLSDAFARAAERARHDVLAFVNADVLLLSDLPPAIERVRALGRAYLIVGESWNARFDGPVDLADEALHRMGRRRGADAIDWFVFSRGLYEDMPPFAIGRTAFDNWLIWRAREAGALVVDASRVVHAVHQDHGYDHFAGGLPAIRLSEEARRNQELAGGKSRFFSRFDATHVLTPRGLRRNLGAPFRWKERSRRAAYKLRHAL